MITRSRAGYAYGHLAPDAEERERDLLDAYDAANLRLKEEHR
jgi:hypothetical protein